jgi:hypothetical protein
VQVVAAKDWTGQIQIDAASSLLGDRVIVRDPYLRYLGWFMHREAFNVLGARGVRGHTTTCRPSSTSEPVPAAARRSLPPHPENR